MKTGKTEGVSGHAHDPRRLDMAVFARHAGALSGAWPLNQLDRLLDGWPADAQAPSGEVSWSAHGELRPVAVGAPEVWLHLHVQTVVWRTCQRCLQPMPVPLEVDRRLRFVAGEDAAAALDAESEEDVLELVRALDLRVLAEDELLLALPLVPRHETCPSPLPLRDDPLAESPEPHPFAALAALKRGTLPPH
jgi:uncharacterized protein